MDTKHVSQRRDLSDGRTAALMAYTAPIELLGRREFQRNPPVAFNPFSVEGVDDKDTEEKIDYSDQKSWLPRLWERFTVFEDAFAMICCTDPRTVAAVAVSWTPIQTSPTSKDVDFLGQPVTHYDNVLLVAGNAGVSEAHKEYISK